MLTRLHFPGKIVEDAGAVANDREAGDTENGLRLGHVRAKLGWRANTWSMSTERKPEETGDWSHQEKQTMSQPQEEFIGDEARPSKDISEVREEQDEKAPPAKPGK